MCISKERITNPGEKVAQFVLTITFAIFENSQGFRYKGSQKVTVCSTQIDGRGGVSLLCCDTVCRLRSHLNDRPCTCTSVTETYNSPNCNKLLFTHNYKLCRIIISIPACNYTRTFVFFQVSSLRIETCNRCWNLISKNWLKKPNSFQCIKYIYFG